MKVSGFTFIRDASLLGYPVRESILSILPICDEFIVNVGDSVDNTVEIVSSIKDPKVKIIHSTWNEKMITKGFVYAQQKMIAHYNCTGDWAFYLEGDEVVHEDDLPVIMEAMRRYERDTVVDALVFDYVHFYCNQHTVLEGPGWLRQAPRIIRNSIRTYSPDGLYFLVLDKGNRRGRYPRAAHSGAKIYHYGWMRPEEKYREKLDKVSKYWDKRPQEPFRYGRIDPSLIKHFNGSHPAVMKAWLPDPPPTLILDSTYRLTEKDIRHRIKAAIEKVFPIDLSRKHFRLVR